MSRLSVWSLLQPHVTPYASSSRQQLQKYEYIWLKLRYRVVTLPAAKCSGVDLRPAMSLAFTFTASTSFFTLETSPFLQASNSSLKAPFAPMTPMPQLAGLLLPDSGVDPGLVALPSVVVGELALLLLVLALVLLLLLALRARDGDVLVVGEAGFASPSATLSAPLPRGGREASSVDAGGEPGGVKGIEELRGGEDSRELG